VKKIKCPRDRSYLLIRYYSRLGNRPMVIKVFEKCSVNIVDGLNCPLSKETEELYKKLIEMKS